MINNITKLIPKTIKSISSKINRAKTLFREGKLILHEEGFISLVKRLLYAHKIVYLYRNDLGSPSIGCNADNPTLIVVTCLEEFDKLLIEGFDFSAYEMSIQQCKERISRRSVLFCVFVDNELAHGTWVSMDRQTHSEFYHFPLNYEHEASLGGTMTIPKYQGKGIYTYVYSQIFQYLRKKGVSRAVFEIHKDNLIAQKAQARLGSAIFSEGHHLRLLYLFNFKWIKPMSGCP